MFVLLNIHKLRGIFISCLLIPGPVLFADEINLSASKDNTIYSEGNLSNGAGQHMFSGTNGIGDFRRALIRFDIAASVPFGATIDGVELTLNVSREPDTFSQNFSLFRITTDWGESSSNAPGQEGMGTDAAFDDATWSHTFFPFTFWNTAGGDIVPEASVTALIGLISRKSILAGYWQVMKRLPVRPNDSTVVRILLRY